jgi:hypothetical protein
MVRISPAMTRSSKVPKQIEASVLFENDHTCCLCRERGKDVVTHHIDGDNSNHDPTNLAVLCLDCHSRVTGTRGLGRKYSSTEVEKYKRDWEFIVRKKRHLIIEPYRKPQRSEVRPTRFEIKRNLYELAATKNSKRAKEILELMDIYHMYDLESDYILHILDILVPIIHGPNICLVAEYILHYFWHLAGPEHTRITKKDIRIIGSAIEVLTWMGEFNAEFFEEGTAVRAALRSLHSLFETVSYYHLARLENKIKKSIQSIRKKMQASEYPRREKASIIASADSYLRRIKSE